MRPQFKFDFPIEQDHAIELLKGVMDDNDYPIEGRAAGNHLMLVIPIRDRHFWSPWLNIELTQLDTNQSNETITKVSGRFSPNPSVWTGYMLVYSSLVVLSFLAAMFGISQMIMGNSPWAFQVIIVFALIAGAMYWSSLIGQRIAQDQMQLLYRVTLETLAEGSGLEVVVAPTSSEQYSEPETTAEVTVYPHSAATGSEAISEP